MREFLIRTFIKDADCIKAPAVRTRYGNLASLTGMLVNIAVCLGELIGGFIVGSLAMISDGLHNVADAGGSAISLLSFRLSARKPDQEHPYGHGRMEYLFSVGFSVLLFVIAIQLLIEAVHRIMNPEIVDFSMVALIVMIVVMGLKIWLHSFLKYMGNRIDSPILRANSLECLSDVWATCGITAGLLIGSYVKLPVDGYLSAIVAVMIGRAGFEVFKESTSRLLGNEPRPERVREIATFVSSYDGVMGIHDLMVHDYGPGHEFASIHVEVDAKQDIIKSHNMVENIERDAWRQLNLRLTIHMDPLVRNKETEEIYDRVRRVIKAYNPDLSIHDLRAVPDGDKINVIFDLVVPYSEHKRLNDIGHAVKEILEAMEPKYIIHLTAEHSYTGSENIHE